MSIKGRFNGNSKEAIDRAKLYGDVDTFYYYKKKGIVGGWDTWKKFLLEETGDPHFGEKPLLDTGGALTARSQFEDMLDWIKDWLGKEKAKVEHQLSQMQAELEEERRKNRELVELVGYYSENHEERVKSKFSEIREYMERNLA